MNRWAPMLFVGVAFAVVFATSSPALGHSGGTDANGCHAGSQPYHCHGSRSVPAPRAPSSGLTLCADGTWSQSTGSGTCSWHGGIAGNNNPSTGPGSPSSGGGTGRIVPGPGPTSSVEVQGGLSRAIASIFYNGGVVYLLIGWWVLARLRKSRSRNAPKSSTARPNATTPLSTAPGLSKTTAPPPVKPTSAGNASTPLSKPSSAAGSCSCGGREVARRNHKSGQRFYGCSRYPGCKRTRPFR